MADTASGPNSSSAGAGKLLGQAGPDQRPSGLPFPTIPSLTQGLPGSILGSGLTAARSGPSAGTGALVTPGLPPLVSTPAAASSMGGMGVTMLPGGVQGQAAMTTGTAPAMSTSVPSSTSALTTFLSAPAQVVAHTNMSGGPALGPAAAVAPATSNALLMQALQATHQAAQAASAAGSLGASNASSVLRALGTAPQTLQQGFTTGQTLAAQMGLPTATAATMPLAGVNTTAAQFMQLSTALQASAALAGISSSPAMSGTAMPSLLSTSARTAIPASPAGAASLAVPALASLAPASAPAAPAAPATQPAVRLPSKVKVLFTYGGVSSTSTAGVLEYCGGETRLVGGLEPGSCSFADLAARMEAECHIRLGCEGVLRYELPGCPGTLVDVKSDQDVANMWSEWSEFCSMSGTPTFKIHLYVDKPPMPARSYRESSSSGGRGSGGRPSGGRGSGGSAGRGPDAGDAILAATSDSAGSSASSRNDSFGPLPGTTATQAAPVAGTPVGSPGGPAGAAVGAPAGATDGDQGGAPAAAPSGRAGAGPAPGPGERARLGMFGGGTETSFGSSFDSLLARVRNSVEIIRPSELRIVRFIGSGGFADCYLAKWLGVEVAVKCFRDMRGCPSTSSKAAIKELMREASVLSGLRHPNVLCLYAVALPDQLASEFGVGLPPLAASPGMGVASPQPVHAGSMLPALTPVPEGLEHEGGDGRGSGSGSGSGGPVAQALSEPMADTQVSQAAVDAATGGEAAPAGPRKLSIKTTSSSGDGRGSGSSPTTSPSAGDAGKKDAKSPGGTPLQSPPTSPFAAAAATAAAAAAGTTTGFGPASQVPLPTAASQEPPPASGAAAAGAPPLPLPKLSGPLASGGGRQPSQALSSMGGRASSGTSVFSPSLAHHSSTASSTPAGSSGLLAEGMLPPPEEGEDDAMKKAVAAAEAASAASADAESQTAVSQGLITRPALVAEFLSGCSLDSAIRRSADFLASDLVICKVALDAARGMEYCHTKRVTHWNLKAGNLIVGFSSDKVPLCKIADIGLSRPRQLSQLDEAGVARVLPWAAPELVRDPSSAGDKVDVYSYGVLLWAMWARKLPYAGQDIARVFMRTMQGQVVRPPQPGTPEWEEAYPGTGRGPSEPVAGWADLMCRCWAQSASARPAFPEVTAAMSGLFNAAKARKRAARQAASTNTNTAGAGGGPAAPAAAAAGPK